MDFLQVLQKYNPITSLSLSNINGARVTDYGVSIRRSQGTYLATRYLVSLVIQDCVSILFLLSLLWSL